MLNGDAGVHVLNGYTGVHVRVLKGNTGVHVLNGTCVHVCVER